MSAQDNGGPAFPVSDPGWLNCKTVEESKRAAAGMTMRDYFAAKAMVELMTDWRASRLTMEDHPGFDEYAEHVARESYFMADAMLKERAK